MLYDIVITAGAWQLARWVLALVDRIEGRPPCKRQ